MLLALRCLLAFALVLQLAVEPADVVCALAHALAVHHREAVLAAHILAGQRFVGDPDLSEAMLVFEVDLRTCI